MSLSVRFMYGGQFFKNDTAHLCYRKKGVFFKKEVDPDLLSRFELEVMVLEASLGIDLIEELWYLKPGMSLNEGMMRLQADADIVEMCNNVGKDKTMHVYVVQPNDISPAQLGESYISSQPILHRALLTPSSTHLLPPSNPKAPYISQQTQLNSDLEEGESNSEFDSDDDSIEIDSADSCGEETDTDGEVGGQGDDISIDETYNVFASDDSDDDKVYRDNIDVDDDAGNDESAIVVREEGLSSGDDDFHKVHDSDGYLSYSGSEDEGKQRYPEFNPLVDFKRPICLKVGMRFGSNKVFRKALRQFAVESGFDYYYLHNDKKRVTAYCKRKCECPFAHGRMRCVCQKSLCKFKACARKMGNDGSFQLKSFDPNHECGWQDTNTKVSSAWLAEKYLETYRTDPRWRIKSFIKTVKRDHGVHITYSQGWRARLRAILNTQGHAPEQYTKIWSYALTILKWNPGSSAFVKVAAPIRVERPLFQRFYVCLDACKQGFRVGCRPIIGIDGCHLKGAYKGQVFSAIAKDGNENIFPLAYAVVEIENKETWCWFLENLIHDIGSNNLTFMSDRQKGLVKALKEIVPSAHTRVCVRHMYNNFKQKWAGKSYKDAVWAAARAATTFDFVECMNRIKDMNEDAYKYLMKQDPQTWSLHGFHHFCKSDMLLNNGSESFNSCILEAREMPILSMCEWIRRKLMKMFVSKRTKMAKHSGAVTPEIMKKIDTAKKEALSKCRCYGNDDRYEVDHGSRSYVVDLGARSCGCNLWDITGIPCSHAICCILKRRANVVQFVDPYYSRDTYMRAYGQTVNPMPGQEQWEPSDQVPPLPPQFVVQPGRPKRKRKREVGENKVGKPKRNQFGKNKCSHCGEEGHYKNKCKNPPKQPQQKTNKGGRPPTLKADGMVTKKRKYTKKARLESSTNEDVTDLFADEEHIQCSNVTQSTPLVVYEQIPPRNKAKKFYPLRSGSTPTIMTTTSQIGGHLKKSSKQKKSKKD